MKYQLTELVKSLSKEEVRNFKLFTSKYKSKGTKALVSLFDIIRKEKMDEYDDEIVSMVLPNGTKNNYYRLKNRLIQEVEDSLADLYRKKDESFEVFRLLRLAKIFSYKSDYEKSKQYLNEAEKTALKLEDYASMHLIYKQYVALISNLSSINPVDYIQRKRKYNKIHQKIEENKFLIASVNYEMRVTNFAGKNQSVLDTLDNLLEQLQIMDELKDSTTMRFEIDQCVRQSLLQRREFALLAEYLEQTFERFSREGLFTKQYHRNKIVMLIWIINTTVKEKQYVKALVYVDILEKTLNEHSRLHYQQYFWLHQTSKIVINSYAGENGQAVAIAKKALSEHSLAINHPHAMAYFISLSTIYYNDKNLNKALEYLSRITADAFFNTLPPVWKISLKIMEIIYHIEDENYNYAKNIYDNLKRSHRDLLKEDGYRREGMFLDILREIIQAARPFKNEKIMSKIHHFLDTYPDFEPAANEGINYNIWLSSKIKRTDYYSELIGR